MSKTCFSARPSNFTVEMESLSPILSMSPFAKTVSSGIWYNCHFKLELPALIAIVFVIFLPL